MILVSGDHCDGLPLKSKMAEVRDKIFTPNSNNIYMNLNGKVYLSEKYKNISKPKANETNEKMSQFLHYNVLFHL